MFNSSALEVHPQPPGVGSSKVVHKYRGVNPEPTWKTTAALLAQDLERRRDLEKKENRVAGTSQTQVASLSVLGPATGSSPCLSLALLPHLFEEPVSVGPTFSNRDGWRG